MRMEIETVTKRTDGGFVVNGILFVPPDPGNRHFRAIEIWIDAGNKPAETGSAPTADQEGD